MLLEDIDLTKLLMLVQELKVQDAWRIVAKSCGLDPALHLGGLSADDLVLALMNRQTRVEDLRECLETLNLQKALSIISEPEKLQITRQPHCDESAQDCLWENDTLLVRIGGQLRLKIEATGTPIPSYLWFRDNIPLSSSPNLVIENFSEHMEGLYYCIVQQQEDYGWEKRVISKDVTIKVSIKVQSEAPQIVCCKPTGKYELERGQDLVAHVEVAPGPPTTYSWWHKGKLLKTFTSNVLIVSEVGENNAGTYECRVKNKFGESSSEFELDVKKRPYPTEKKALIITNSLYMKMQQLSTPHHDAISLKNGLSEFNFDCTHLQDLTAADMSREIVRFFRGLKKGAYVLFYFGGHGLMKNNTKYLMGCDADPDNLKVEQVLPETLLEEVQGADPTLFMSILDMCQISINGFNFEVQQSTNKWTNAVLCYATSQNRLAYEPANSLNSVYMKHLQNVLLYEQNLSFVDMILKVNSRVQDDKPDQVPQVSIVGENHFKLSDVVRKKLITS